MSLNYSFAGKKVLITGGGQGIGRQLVQRFHDGGAIVYTVDRNEESILKLREELPKVTAEIVDLTDWKATEKVVEGFGPMDHLVNNAGVFEPQAFLAITEEMASRIYETNVGAVINVTQIVAKGMIASGCGGNIVNISSIGARTSMPTMSCYGGTKAAIELLTKSMAVELGPHNIRVNCVLPGRVKTPMSEGEVIGEDLRKFVEGAMEKMVIKRLVDSNEVADLILFLLSPLSSMIVGEAVVIDGGFMLS